MLMALAIILRLAVMLSDPMFVGANLFQRGFTQFCLLEKILLKLGFPKN
jgi:hypothetical protein